MELQDFANLAQTAQRVDANPVVLAGRLAGLSADEQSAGIPTWAYAVSAFLVGGVVVYSLQASGFLRFGGRGG